MAETHADARDRIRFEALEQVFRRGPVNQAVRYAEGWRDDEGTVPLDISHLLLARNDLPANVRDDLSDNCICGDAYGWHNEPLQSLP